MRKSKATEYFCNKLPCLHSKCPKKSVYYNRYQNLPDFLQSKNSILLCGLALLSCVRKKAKTEEEVLGEKDDLLCSLLEAS